MTYARYIMASALASCFLSGCGADPARETNLAIFQGQETTAHESVGLLIRDGKLWCTATIIGPKVALSAGHCFEGKSSKPTSLFIDFNGGSIRTQVSEVIVHPKYSDWFGRVSQDLALLKLVDEPGLPPMNLATMAPTKGESVVFVGYGFTDSLAKESFDGTKRTGTNVVGTIEARKLFFPKPANEQVSQVCRGDSGGPIFAARQGQLELIGVVSGSMDGAARKTCRIEAYAARVDAFVEWIHTTASLAPIIGKPLD